MCRKAKLKISAVAVAVATILLSALFCLAAAQDGKEKVAFYLSGKEPKAGVYKPLRGLITKAIVNSGTYMAIDRTEEVLGLIAKEQKYQRSGAVDDAKISELGRQWGTKYVVAIEVTPSISGFYLEAKMVDVEKAYVAKMGEATSKLASDEDLRAAANEIIRDLGLGGGTTGGGGGASVATPAQTAPAQTAPAQTAPAQTAPAPQAATTQTVASTQQAMPSQPTVAVTYFTDPRNGQKYRVVKIENQTWMAENLNYKTGTSWCYDDKESNCEKYGRLYDWNTAKSTCPKGWHLPSSGEWRSLVKAAGDRYVAGKKLKSKSGWKDYKGKSSGNGTDEFGFSALPGGNRGNVGSFYDVGSYGTWWSATEGGRGAYYRSMYSDVDDVDEDTYYESYGFSVRCAQD